MVNQSEWAVNSAGTYGPTGGTIQGLGHTTSVTSPMMTQGSYVTFAGTSPTGVQPFSTFDQSGSGSASYFGKPDLFNIAIFEKDYRGALTQEPVVDGFTHAAQSILERAFVSEPENLARWFERMIREYPNSSKTADTLRLLARFKPYTPEWRYQIVSTALGALSVDVRDAGIQAVESWAE